MRLIIMVLLFLLFPAFAYATTYEIYENGQIVGNYTENNGKNDLKKIDRSIPEKSNESAYRPHIKTGLELMQENPPPPTLEEEQLQTIKDIRDEMGSLSLRISNTDRASEYTAGVLSGRVRARRNWEDA